MSGAEEAELFPGRPGYFPVAGLYQDVRTSILVGPAPRVWPRQRDLSWKRLDSFSTLPGLKDLKDEAHFTPYR